jgi:hypothetical protein
MNVTPLPFLPGAYASLVCKVTQLYCTEISSCRRVYLAALALEGYCFVSHHMKYSASQSPHNSDCKHVLKVHMCTRAVVPHTSSLCIDRPAAVQSSFEIKALKHHKQLLVIISKYFQHFCNQNKSLPAFSSATHVLL